MRKPIPLINRTAFGLNFWLLTALLLVLCIAGGASRANVMGQVVVRAAAWASLVAVILFGTRPIQPLVRGGAIPVLLVVAIAIPLVQLVPLPPSVWQALPGRAAFVAADAFVGGAPWRPIAIVPSATLNAASSLIVPFVVFVLAAGLSRKEDQALVVVLLGTVGIMMLSGLLQFSGVALLNPFVNGEGAVDGLFANRNHFALFMAIGCLLSLVWGFGGGTKSNWRVPVAAGLVMLLILTILASGSRGGIVVGVVAMGAGAALIAGDARAKLARFPRRIRLAILGGLGLAMAAILLLSVFANRAVSIDRALSLDLSQDMRSRSLGVVTGMVRDYFPVGSGLGGFDPVFRLHEPFRLLKPTYFNHAHNDFMEIVLDAGLAGLLALLAAIAWWGWASVKAWRRDRPGGVRTRARLGSFVLLLVFIASIADYPARTPLIMAVVMIAALWLAGVSTEHGDALPEEGQLL